MAFQSINLAIGDANRPFFFRPQTTDEAVIKQIFVDQNYNIGGLGRGAELFEFLRKREADGLRPLVVDAGANIGASPVYLAVKLPHAKIVAIEPERGNFEVLSKNAENLSIECVQAAIASSRGRARVIDPGGGGWMFRTESAADADASGETVPRVTVNDIYAAHREQFFPFMVKIDIEGGEGDLFAANTEWVAETPIVAIELHDWMLPKQGTSRSFLKCVAALDRDFVYLGENIFSIANDLDRLAAAKK